jgi:glycosyltransferase involved in cell wall biosynthesis
VSALRRIVVVIPARNEEGLIGRCLDSVDEAVAQLHRPAHFVSVIVVADGCTDATARLVRARGVRLQEISAGSVGTARATGVRLALPRQATPLSRVWIANTDADSAVPANWLTEQVALADSGCDLMIGTVRPDFDDLSVEQIAAWQARHEPGVANGHVHGANLGIRASAYAAAGGFRNLTEHEDNDLVDRLLARGTAAVATAACEVLTSGRQDGRTAGGYAGYLREQLVTESTGPATDAERAGAPEIDAQ